MCLFTPYLLYFTLKPPYFEVNSDDTTHPILGEPIHIHETVKKAHGRLETRCLKASTSLNAYLDWPGIAQVMAAMRNTALSALRFAGYTAISDTIKYLASKPKLTVNLIK